jgi:glycosyltransferase involved in cell wall biosynthesis
MRMKDIFLPFQVILICWLTVRYRIDIMHSHKRLAILQASLAGRIMNVPVVATVHGRPRYDMRSRLSRRMTDRIIFVSAKTFEANRYNEFFTSKSVLIHNGVRICNNQGTRNHNTMLYVCRIDKKHASVISMLITNVLPGIIRNFPNVTFEIVGDGKFLEDLKKEAGILNREHNREVCRFHGYLNDVRPVVNRSGIVMGVGRVALEALSCSVPVISLNRMFLGQIITKDNYEFYRLNNFVAIDNEEPDPVKLTGILNDYLRDPLYWHNEAKEIRKSVEENLSIEKITSDIKVLYQETCVDKKRPLLYKLYSLKIYF